MTCATWLWIIYECSSIKLQQKIKNKIIIKTYIEILSVNVKIPLETQASTCALNTEP